MKLSEVQVGDWLVFGVGNSRLPFEIVDMVYDKSGQIELPSLKKDWESYNKLIIKVTRNGKTIFDVNETIGSK